MDITTEMIVILRKT